MRDVAQQRHELRQADIHLERFAFGTSEWLQIPRKVQGLSRVNRTWLPHDRLAHSQKFLRRKHELVRFLGSSKLFEFESTWRKYDSCGDCLVISDNPPILD